MSEHLKDPKYTLVPRGLNSLCADSYLYKQYLCIQIVYVNTIFFLSSVREESKRLVVA